MRFLRWFPQFLAIEAQLIEAANARIYSEDQTRMWRSRCEIAEHDKEKAQASLEHALKQVANHQAMQAGCVNVPFPEVFVGSPRSEESDQRPANVRRSARDVQLEAIANSRRAARMPLRSDDEVSPN